MAPTLRPRRRSNTAAAAIPTTIAPAAATNDDEESMEVDCEPYLRLKTCDGKRFTLTKSEASCFNALRILMEANQNCPNASSEYIHLPSVDSQMLAKVIEWCQVHGSDDAMNTTNSSVDIDTTYAQAQEINLSDWDKRFIESMSEEELFKLIHVVSYLDVRTLFDACCQVVGKRWEGKKVEEIRRMYNIKGDFSLEEENQMIQENKKMGLTD